MGSQTAMPPVHDESRLAMGLRASGFYGALVGVVFFFPLTLDALFAGSDGGMGNPASPRYPTWIRPPPGLALP